MDNKKLVKSIKKGYFVQMVNSGKKYLVTEVFYETSLIHIDNSIVKEKTIPKIKVIDIEECKTTYVSPSLILDIYEDYNGCYLVEYCLETFRQYNTYKSLNSMLNLGLTHIVKRDGELIASGKGTEVKICAFIDEACLDFLTNNTEVAIENLLDVYRIYK